MNLKFRSLVPTPSKTAWTTKVPAFRTLTLRWKSLWMLTCTISGSE